MCTGEVSDGNGLNMIGAVWHGCKSCPNSPNCTLGKQNFKINLMTCVTAPGVTAMIFFLIYCGDIG